MLPLGYVTLHDKLYKYPFLYLRLNLLFSSFKHCNMACASGLVSFVGDFRTRIRHKFIHFFHPAEEQQESEEEREHNFQTKLHRYNSFAPVRHDSQVKFFIDGHDYCW